MAKHEYWPEQATAILNFTEAKFPGWLENAEKVLREYDMWPTDEECAPWLFEEDE